MPETETGGGPHPSVTRYLLSQEEPSAKRLVDMEGHIIHGDALIALGDLPDDSVDLIHTSPPYNIDKPYQSDLSDRSSIANYTAFLTRTITEIKRVLRPGGSVFWQTGYTQSDNPTAEMVPIDYLSYQIFSEGSDRCILWDRIIWRYWGGHAFTKKFTNKHETILWFTKPGADPTFCVDAVRERAKEYDKRNNFWGRNPGNVWEVDRVAFGSTEQTSHIAVFPEELSERIIRACSRPGDLVLDPFSGSGTVPKVARGLGRRWLGVEISAVYAAESTVRIGFQQPSERDSLASALLKSLVFRKAPGRRSLEEAAERLRAWVAASDIERRRRDFEADIAEVFHDGNGRNHRKRDVWARYDSLLQDRPAADPIVMADSLLLSCYKLRHRLSGVARHRSALEAIEKLASQLLTDDAASRLATVVRQEPSSFMLDGDAIELLTDRRSISLAAAGLESRADPSSAPGEGSDGEATFQSRLL